MILNNKMLSVIGRVNFKKNEKTYDAEKSAVFKVLQEEQNDPEPGIRDIFITLVYHQHPQTTLNFQTYFTCFSDTVAAKGRDSN